MKTVLPFRPKIIVWQLIRDLNPVSPASDCMPLSTQECHLVIESIARLARPIVVFTGHNVLQRPDLFSITEYAFAFGLKVIIEVSPGELNDEVVRKFSVFGKRIFRILVDRCVVEDIDDRNRHSDQFIALERAVQRVRDAGLESHLGTTIKRPNVRQLAYDHDYAIRRSASGFYCHLSFDAETDPHDRNGKEASEVDALIDAISRMKSFSPQGMYFSPQCVRYSHRDHQSAFHLVRQDSCPVDEADMNNPPSEWLHWCMGGKTFAYIDVSGAVQLCAGIPSPCGDLRQAGYDFARIWEDSEVMHGVRDNEWSCTETRDQFVPKVEANLHQPVLERQNEDHD